MPDSRLANLKEVFLLFLKLGFTAFGGPAAHIGMMHAEVVRRRRWLDEAAFLDLLGATNLIPGPNSTEMTIHLGYLRAGWPGLVLGGTAFILPAMLIVTGIAWVYTRFGTLPAASWLLYGVKPVVIAIIAQAIWGLAQKAIKKPLHVLVGLIVFGLYFFEVNEIGLLFSAGLLVAVVENRRRFHQARIPAVFPLLGNLFAELARRLSIPVQGAAAAMLASAPFSLPVLFLTFLKIGAVLYGSGYVLLAFLHADFVARLGWLSDKQLIDAIAVGQVTPGPVFTSATFIGYILGGFPGALLGTLGIFLPGFIFVAISNPLIPRIRASSWAAPLLDGVNIASLGLMAAVTVQLGRDALVDPLTVIAALAAAVLLLRYKVNSTWLIAAGALAGLANLWIR